HHTGTKFFSKTHGVRPRVTPPDQSYVYRIRDATPSSSRDARRASLHAVSCGDSRDARRASLHSVWLRNSLGSIGAEGCQRAETGKYGFIESGTLNRVVREHIFRDETFQP